METDKQTLKEISKSLKLSQGTTENLCNITTKPDSFPYTTKEILERLVCYKKNHPNYDEIEMLGLYGSCARNEQRAGSDIDIAVKLRKPNLLRLISIENELKELFTVETNVVSLTSNFPPGILDEITKDIIFV